MQELARKVFIFPYYRRKFYGINSGEGVKD